MIASVLIATLAAACGAPTTGSALPTGATGATGATGTARASSPSPSGTGARASSVADACSLVARSDAEAIVGSVSEQPAKTSAPVPGVADRGAACVYRGANGVLTVAVLERATARADFDGIARQVPGVQPLSGIGDSAYGTSIGGGAGGATVLVLKGTTYFSLAVTSSSKSGDALLESLKTIASKVAASL